MIAEIRLTKEEMAELRSGISPLRSFRMELAPTAIEVNKLLKEKRIDKRTRARLHASLLDVSASMPPSPEGNRAGISPDLLKTIAEFDTTVNGRFYAARAKASHA